MDKILMKVRAILLYEHWTIEWMFRILFSINILMPAFTYDEHYYTIIVLGFSVVGFWLYVARLKVFALAIMLLVLPVNYFHYHFS